MFKNKSLVKEIFRIGVVLLLSCAVLFNTELYPLLKMGIGASILILAFSHILRRVIVPYVHLEKIYAKVMESDNYIACSIIFASVMYFITIIVQAISYMIKLT